MYYSYDWPDVSEQCDTRDYEKSRFDDDGMTPRSFFLEVRTA